VEVLTDGELAHVSTRQEGRLIVELPRSPRANEVATVHTLELRYRRPAPVGVVTRHVFTPPQLVATSALSEVYWHIVLSGDRHIVRSPAQLVSVDTWQWLEMFWGRRPARTQAEIEAWAGATHQLAPSAAQNEYLFSGLAPVASIEVLTAPRWLVVLVISGTVLGLVSLSIYLPPLRKGWVGILAAVLIAGMAVAYPAPAVLVGQASVLGVVLAAIAVVLRQLLRGRFPGTPPTTGNSNLRVRSSYRPDSVTTPPAATPSASGTPTMHLTVPEADR
jgi:hypothetical protein